MNLRLKLFILLAIGFSYLSVPAQDASWDDNTQTQSEMVVYDAPDDTTNVFVKNFSKSRVAELKTNKDFNYQQPPTRFESLWQRLLQWFSRFLAALFEGATATDWGRVLVYVVTLVGFIAIILMILRVNAFKIFYAGADQGNVSSSVFHENIHEMDFEKLLREALEKQKYRDGIRLVFLSALKVLADRQLILWQAGKTNHDYVNELNASDLKTNLHELSFYFDYAWYGNFPIQESTFRKTEQLYQSLKNKAS